MPDLAIVTMQQCSDFSITRWEIASSKPGKFYTVELQKGEYWCDCPAFKFQKRKVDDRLCKHVMKAKMERCSYHEQYDGPPEMDGTCPKCGNPTEYVRVGV